MTAPATPANYNFQWRVVQDFVEWFGDYSTNVQVAVSGAGGNGGNAAECTWQSVPSTMVAGQSYTLTVKMLNTGSNTWTTANHYNLGSANDNGAWGLYRVALPASIAPNQEATFTFAVTAPSTPGTYNFQWRMVQDFVEWFGDTSTNVSVTVTTQGPPQVHWLVTDQLGTPRMVLDQSGTLANLRRHDYLPFGEELFSPTSARTAVEGYTSGDGVRQHFTQKERDAETDLDYFGARYVSSTQGRFTAADPVIIAATINAPQGWNRYSYTLNNPLRFTDPDGKYHRDVHYDLTRLIAMAVGFSEEIASKIASADQGTDENPKTSPMPNGVRDPGIERRKKWHFTTPERRKELWDQFNTTGLTDDLGIYLHALQDSYSHAGYGPVFGQTWNLHPTTWEYTDDTFRDVAKADTMAEDTYNHLDSAAEIMESKGTFKTRIAPMSWGQISGVVQSFNSANTEGEKHYYLEILENRIKTWQREQLKKREVQDKLRYWKGQK